MRVTVAERNNMHPETVEALAVVLEGYKNNIIYQTFAKDLVKTFHNN